MAKVWLWLAVKAMANWSHKTGWHRQPEYSKCGYRTIPRWY